MIASLHSKKRKKVRLAMRWGGDLNEFENVEEGTTTQSNDLKKPNHMAKSGNQRQPMEEI